MTVLEGQFHPDAQRDLRGAARRYESEQPGLGDDFVVEIDDALGKVFATPRTWPMWPDLQARVPVRRYLAHRFPFGVGYVIRETDVVVVAIAHLKRRPGYWIDRLGSLPPPL